MLSGIYLRADILPVRREDVFDILNFNKVSDVVYAFRIITRRYFLPGSREDVFGKWIFNQISYVHLCVQEFITRRYFLPGSREDVFYKLNF